MSQEQHRLFRSCTTPLICEGNDCGSMTYGYWVAKYDMAECKRQEHIRCGGCDHLQSVEYTKYLNSEQYAYDQINAVLWGEADFSWHVLNYFVEWIPQPKKDMFLEQMITIQHDIVRKNF